MRVAADESHPWYDASVDTSETRAFLDGEEVQYCVAASDEDGEVHILDLDAFNAGTEELPLIVRRGKVVIRMNAAA